MRASDVVCLKGRDDILSSIANSFVIKLSHSALWAMCECYGMQHVAEFRCAKLTLFWCGIIYAWYMSCCARLLKGDNVLAAWAIRARKRPL